MSEEEFDIKSITKRMQGAISVLREEFGRTADRPRVGQPAGADHC